MMNFDMIRKHYKVRLPEMQAIFEQSGNMFFDPYELDFLLELTPIETSVWIDIRSEPIPMYPQLPILKYFLDFANPFVKVAIECDGKQWHDPAKDAIRDAKLIDAGWTIYRIPGSECNRIVQDPFDLRLEMEHNQQDSFETSEAVYDQAKKWFVETSQGIIRAIAIEHFGKKSEFDGLANLTLDMHKSGVA